MNKRFTTPNMKIAFLVMVLVVGFNKPQWAYGQLEINEIDNYFLGLDKWQDLSRPQADKLDASGKPTKKPQGKYECVEQDYSLTKTPDAIVVFWGTPTEALWPGSVLQGKPYLNGHIGQLPVAQLAATDITINLSIPNGSVKVDNPTKATMQAAIGELIARAKDTENPADAILITKEAFSQQQLLLDLNISAKYLNQSAKAALTVDKDVETRTIAAYYYQNMFTVSIPPQRTPSSYFDKISMEDIKDQIAQGNIGKDNPPLYVKSISYGRILLFTMTSKSSKTDIEAAIKYAYRGVEKIDADLKAKYNSILSSSEIRVVPYGGLWKEAAQLIRSAKIADYFSDKAPPLTTALPISYQLNTIARGVPAAAAETTKYTQRDCHLAQAPVVKKNGKFTLQYVGGGDNRYLSLAEWASGGFLQGKWPYPTLQLRPVDLQFRGTAEPMKSGTNIRFRTLETKADSKKLGKYFELSAGNAKYVFYNKPKKGPKPNWIFIKKNAKDAIALFVTATK